MATNTPSGNTVASPGATSTRTAPATLPAPRHGNRPRGESAQPRHPSGPGRVRKASTTRSSSRAV
ncbi:hypothetical protein ACIQGO_11575, partial [Streptomyces shenzhenensis]|uniref:hypothetical protein n=1 Tax=Streptomyces shenzhenensis TaxID=943815 RepID=UPI0037F9CD74